jgi:hypothetical protein
VYLADHMRTDRTVCIPRQRVADALGCSERRINDWNTAARDAGLLDVVVRGQKHVTAIYVGLFPEPLSGTKSSPLRTTENQPPESGLSGTPGGPTTSKRPPTSYAVGDVPNEKRQLGEVPHESTAEVRDRARHEYDEEASA